ncbi:hypothetical protein [Pseudonocardia thermophila]|uniref:hypothetical protein n=1 Tax=Pseudonocardia thermophila TaxID=1848 RepID=UPI00248D6A27|nr:hypothetical protein [Pseudonocardia thermophila]
MRIYAERPFRILRQFLSDVLAIGWVVVVALAALAVREVILRLQGPATALADAGESIRNVFDGAARTAGGVPFVGGELSSALGAGAGAGDRIAEAGREQAETIAAVATGTAVLVIVIGILPVLFVWLPLRVRYARLASAAVAVRGLDDDLLALRAITRQPVRRLLKVSADPAAAWRKGDPEVVAGLATLELRRLGLRKP